MSYKTKRGKKLPLQIGGILCVGIILLIMGLLFYTKGNLHKKIHEYEEKLEAGAQCLQEKERFLYVAKKDIRAGETLTADMVRYEKGYSSMENHVFAENVEGKTACARIPKGTQVLHTMLTENTEKEAREEEFRVFYLSENLKPYDVVDIRILYPNGENYIVLSKKILKELNQERTTCYLWMEEQETLFISSAMVDAYMTPGAILYTTKYVESEIQKPSIVTYIPSHQVMDLIQKNPNIVESAKLGLEKQVREKLEFRLEKYIKEEGKGKKEFRDYLYGKRKREEQEEPVEPAAEQGIEDTTEQRTEDAVEEMDREEEEITYVE
ncbi:MAG: SAF domain-containing protein [Acetivibrio sp.]